MLEFIQNPTGTQLFRGLGCLKTPLYVVQTVSLEVMKLRVQFSLVRGARGMLACHFRSIASDSCGRNHHSLLNVLQKSVDAYMYVHTFKASVASTYLL